MTAPHDLSYEAARPSPIRRWWRRLRLPALGVVLAIALLLTPVAYRRADGWMIDRDRAWWRQRMRAASPGDGTMPDPATVRRLMDEVGPDLVGGLTHRNEGVAIYALLTLDGIVVRMMVPNGVETRFPAEVTADLLRHAGSLPAHAMPSYGFEPADLRPALRQWDELDLERRLALLRAARVWGPDAPGAADVVRRAAESEPARLPWEAKRTIQVWRDRANRLRPPRQD